MPRSKGYFKKEQLKSLLNASKNCVHHGRLKKDSSYIVCSSYLIIEHDGCITEGGCDAVAICIEKEKALLIEGKCGRIDEHDASAAVRQLLNCFEYYRDKLIGFNLVPIFLKEKGQRLESYARDELKRCPRKLGGIHIAASGDDLSQIQW
jgi:hypothetical protein